MQIISCVLITISQAPTNYYTGTKKLFPYHQQIISLVPKNYFLNTNKSPKNISLEPKNYFLSANILFPCH